MRTTPPEPGGPPEQAPPRPGKLRALAWTLAFVSPGAGLAALEAFAYLNFSARERADAIALGLALLIPLGCLFALRFRRVRGGLFARRWPLAFSGALLLAGLGVAEYFLERALTPPPIRKRGALLRHDPELGFEPIPGAVARQAMPGVYDVEYRINSLGLRGEEFPKERPEGERLRALAVGCSLTFGFGVSEEDSWAFRLGEALGPSARVVNAGVVAYGPQQMFLRARRLAGELDPDIVLVALARDHCTRLGLDDDWNNSLRGSGWGLPRVRVEDGPEGKRLAVRPAGSALPPPLERRMLLAGKTVVVGGGPGRFVLFEWFHGGLLAVARTIADPSARADAAASERSRREHRLRLLGETLEAFALLQGENGPRVAIVLLPEPELASAESWQEYAAFAKERCAELGLEAWDIGPDAAKAIKGPWRLNRFFEPHYHPAACAAIAQALASRLNEPAPRAPK